MIEEQSAMTRPIDPGTRIGHVHLKVADLERALGFYCGILDNFEDIRPSVEEAYWGCPE